MSDIILEDDLRLPEFRGVKLEELERRKDGKIVRKDRWERGLVSTLSSVNINPRSDWEIPDVVTRVKSMAAGREKAGDCAKRMLAAFSTLRRISPPLSDEERQKACDDFTDAATDLDVALTPPPPTT